MGTSQAEAIDGDCRAPSPWTSGGENVKGVQFLVDNRGKKTGVVIDLREYRELWEDFYDAALARARRKEPRESLAAVRRRLRRSGKLRADITALTQLVANELEAMIAAEPTQWHVLQPVWPSDPGYHATA